MRVFPDNVFQKLQTVTTACRAAEETASVLRRQLAQSESDRASSLAQEQQAQARYDCRVRDWKGKGEWGRLKGCRCIHSHHNKIFWPSVLSCVSITTRAWLIVDWSISSDACRRICFRYRRPLWVAVIDSPLLRWARI